MALFKLINRNLTHSVQIYRRLSSITSSVHVETYGCQMNQSDSEIAKSILVKAGFNLVPSVDQSDTVLLMTCAVRESAEKKIWKRLEYLRSVSDRRKKPMKIGILGCMAERLKHKLLTGANQTTPSSSSNSLSLGADFVCGPDAYRDLPRLIGDAHSGMQGASLALSLEETYADITPIRRCTSTEQHRLPNPCAYVSIMRGCNNMCTYCIVPFVRGRERSRPIISILDEAKHLVNEGYKEITLLGQNVNSYCDTSHGQSTVHPSGQSLTPGFREICRPRRAGGVYFADLLDQLSLIDSELRIRFTSPHPKNFPVEVLQLIAERPNICSHIHLPAQSGSMAVLEHMGRGYSPQAYRQLVDQIHSIIPDVALTSDFIAGFCGETEVDHQDTLALMKDVQYAYTFCFPYSMREKTRAYHRLEDDVPVKVKSRRHLELKELGRSLSLQFNQAQIGCIQLVLIEGLSRRSDASVFGRNDFNIKVVLPRWFTTGFDSEPCELIPGDYAAIEIESATSQTLHGRVIKKCSLKQFYRSETEYYCNSAAGI